LFTYYINSSKTVRFRWWRDVFSKKTRFFDKNTLFSTENYWILHKIDHNFFLHSQKFSARCHYSVKFYEKQLCITSLSRENSYMVKIDFFDKNPAFYWNSHKIDHNFFLQSQKSTLLDHFNTRCMGDNETF
jgi:hypothetical protein